MYSLVSLNHMIDATVILQHVCDIVFRANIF